MILDENGLFIYKTHIIGNPIYRRKLDKWSDNISEFVKITYSNLESIVELNNPELIHSRAASSLELLAFRDGAITLLPSESIKRDLLDEVDFTLKYLSCIRERIEYLKRFQLKIVSFFMELVPILHTNSSYVKSKETITSSYTEELLRCDIEENKQKQALHYFYQNIQLFLAEITIVEEFVKDKIFVFEKAQLMTFKSICQELDCATYRLVLMHRVGKFAPFMRENYNNTDKLSIHGEKQKFAKLVMDELGLNGNVDGFRPSLLKLMADMDKKPRTKKYLEVVTPYAKDAVEVIIQKYPDFFKNMELNDIY